MSNVPVRVGIIGAGANTTSKHIPGLQAIEDVEIVSVCNRSMESSERVAREFNIAQPMENWLDLIHSADTNAIVIGTWPYMHARLTLAALDAGKHVLCEARMARNAEEAHAMLQAAQRSPHLVTQIVPSPMTLGVDKTIKRLLAEGYLGDVLAIEVRAGGDFLNFEGAMHWRNDFDLSGFNTMTMGIWYEAILRWVGGATKVAAFGKTFVKQRRGPDGLLKPVRVPDHIDVLGDMECGAQLHMQVSSLTGHAGAPEVWLFGSRGTLRFSQGKLFGGQRDDSGLEEITISAEDQGGWRVEDEFVSAIRGLEPVTHTSFEDGVKYMEFTEAALRSLAEGQTYSLPL